MSKVHKHKDREMTLERISKDEYKVISLFLKAIPYFSNPSHFVRKSLAPSLPFWENQENSASTSIS